MKKVILSLVLLAVAGAGKAQSVQDYFFKSWDLTYVSPAALTQDGGLKGNLHYYQDLVGSVQANVGGQLQLHTNVGTNHGVGISIQNNRSGVLAGNGVGAGYAYRVRLAANQTLSLGARFNYFKYSINRAGVAHADVSDPMLYGDMFQHNNLLIATGLLYEVGNFKLAVNAPEVLPLEGASYTRRNYSAYLDYTFPLNDWQVRPNFYFENVATLGNWYESGLYISYKNRFAVEGGYTSENALRAKASVGYGSFTIGYGYNSGKTAKEGSASQTGHRIYVGYNFGDIFAKAKKRREQEELEKKQVESLVSEKTQLIDDYKKVLGQTEENYQKSLQQTADSLSRAMVKSYEEALQAAEAAKGKATITGGYYVAIAAFDTMDKTAEFIQKVTEAGFTSRVLYNSELKKYRVYLDNYKNYREAVKWRDRLREKGFTDSYIFIVK